MRLPELKALARDRGLGSYSRMRKAELVALLKNDGTPDAQSVGEAQGPRTPAPPTPPQRPPSYVTLKFDDNGSCRIHRVSDGGKEIVTNERYFVMPWKMVDVNGKRVSLKEAVDEIFSNQDELTNSTYVTLKLDDKGSCKIHGVSDGDGCDPLAHKEIVINKTYVVMPWKMVTKNGKNMTLKEAIEEIETQRREKEEERRLVYAFEAEHSDAIDRIFELYEYLHIEDIRAMFPEIYEFGPNRLGIHLESVLIFDSYSSDYLINRGYNRLDYFRQIIRAYLERDENADKYVKKVKELMDKPMDEIEFKQVRLAMAKVKCPRKLDISVFYQLTRRLPHEGLGYDGHDERFLNHLNDTFCNENIKLLGKMVRCRTNYVLYHLLDKIGKEPNADHFQFM